MRCPIKAQLTFKCAALKGFIGGILLSNLEPRIGFTRIRGH